jgi:penicillin-binding protein 1B
MKAELKRQINEAVCWMRLNSKRIRQTIALSLFVILNIAAVWLVTTYQYYAAIVDRHLTNHAFKIPAGIYAAPRHLNVGTSLTRDDVIERLRRAGYQEGSQPNEFAAGSFQIQNDAVEITTNDFNQKENLPAKVQVSFKNHLVAQLEDLTRNKSINSIQLPGELLTADPSTKNQARSATRFDELPKVLINALCAIEDRNYFSHEGVDVKAITRAFYKNLFNGGIREGGSTLTQQLIKNSFLTSERTYERKIAEAMMAIALERRLSKEQIMALYCDHVYVGQSGMTSVYGFKQAARAFFGQELNDLTLAQAALLAGLVKAPNHYSPYKHLDEALARRDLVLDAMVETGAISETEAEAAKRERAVLIPSQPLDATTAPHFVDYVNREIEKRRYDEETASQLRVETTLDLDLQEAANGAVTTHLNKLDKNYKKRSARPEAGLIALDPQTGEILAMVGGRDYTISQLNRVTDAMRQPGSVFKPIIYAAAMSQGISPLTTFLNAPHDINFGYKAVYHPQNYGHSYSNTEVTLREAIVRSLNIVAVDAAIRVGLGNVAKMADRMGMEQSHTYPSMALGTSEASLLQVADAYTTFANDGVRVEPLAIHAIGSGGPAIPISASKTHIISPQVAYVVTDTLADVVNRGTAGRVRSLGYRGAAAGKTGTSRDAWFVGYTPKLLVAVWVGFDDNSNLALTGGEAAVPIWTEFMKQAVMLRPDLAAERFESPGGLQTFEIDPETGMQATEYCPHRQKVVLPSSLMPGFCYSHQAPVMELDMDQLNPAVYDETEPGIEDEALDKAMREIRHDPSLVPDEMKVPENDEPPPPPDRPKRDQDNR